MGRVPVTKWLPAYNWRQDLRADIIGGLMLSIMTLPQGLAYGYLVGVPPIYGLITAIFGPIFYAVFGSSKHTSPGSFAIAALMVGGVVEQFGSKPPHAGNNDTAPQRLCCKASASAVPPDEAVGIASSVTLLAGLWQIFFGLLNAGLLAVWLSDHLVQGLTSGAAIHVFTSQLKSMTGVDGVPPTSEAFGLIKFYLCFFRRLHTIKIPSAVVSIISISLLLLSNYFMDPILRKWTKVKFPMEFVLVAFSTLIVFLAEGTRYDINVPIVGKVESGIPAPRVPPLDQADVLIWQALSISIISFVIHIALAKLISKKLNYEIDANQEWFALGAMNAIASFFGCFASGSSLGRTMMQVKFGTKSQMSTLVCCTVMVGFVYGAASFIYHLPKVRIQECQTAILAAIIVVAMKDLFIQLFRGLRLCKESIVDFMIFLVTFVAVILINVNMGLIVGIAFALLSVVFRTQWADSTCMGRIPGTSDFKGLGHYRSAEEIPGIKVFRFDAPLYFANAELFILSVHNACGLNPVLVRSKLNERAAAEAKAKSQSEQNMDASKGTSDMQLRFVGRRVAEATDSVMEDPTEHVVTQLTHIIIDCSSIPYVDLMGKDALAQTYADYSTIDITVLMANCKVAVRQLFETTDFYQKVPKNRMFVNVNDAVIQALKEQRQRFPERNVTMDTSDVHAQVSKDPVALSPAPRTVISNVNEEREEETQSAVSATPSTLRGDLSTTRTTRKKASKVKKSILKTDRKKKEELADKKKKEESVGDKKKKEEPAKKDADKKKKEESVVDKKKKDEHTKKDEKKKEEGKRVLWLRPFAKASRKPDLEKTQ
ncbi:Sulfate transporter [Trichostrongylus colubriformis]|uniref:Sulfate transporter n=1 Tax=Trichostrongylus colubriformis TaxID=6319 RepID=A0AAN8G693_TRICO